MTRALIRKELRELRPWGILSLVAGLLTIAPQFFEPIDMLPLAATFASLSDADSALFWFMGFAIATGITTREQMDGTLAFLDGLPVTRTRIFIAKSIVVLLLVLLAPAVRFASAIVLHLLSRGSLDHDLHLPLLLQAFWLQSLMIANAVFVGAALGRLRNATWMVFGAIVTGLLWLEQRYPRAALLDPLRLLDAELTPSGLEVAMETMWAQLAITIVAFAIAWVAFVRIGRVRQRMSPRRPVVGTLSRIATVITIGSAIVLWFDTRESAEDISVFDSGEPYFAPSAPALTQTRYYRISYPAEESTMALKLAEQSDEIFERVHELLHVPLGEPIEVDASGSAPNTEGTAFFGRIRLRLSNDMRIVLAHETAHVVAQRLAGSERDWLWEDASVLSEGLATWVHYQFDPQSREREQGLFVLATLQTRRELSIEELAEPKRLMRVRDENLKYPAGEGLIAAVVRLYGAEALPRLLRTFADPRLPSDLSGLELWRATFQLAGMNLGAVVDEFYREVTRYAQQHVDAIAALPRPRVRLVRHRGRIGVQALVDGELGEAGPLVQLRFKPQPDSGIDALESEHVLLGQPLWRDPEDIVAGRICVQAGLTGFGRLSLFEPWACLPVRDAAPWQPPADEVDE
jgi:hypothetical protein